MLEARRIEAATTELEGQDANHCATAAPTTRLTATIVTIVECLKRLKRS